MMNGELTEEQQATWDALTAEHSYRHPSWWTEAPKNPMSGEIHYDKSNYTCMMYDGEKWLGIKV